MSVNNVILIDDYSKVLGKSGEIPFVLSSDGLESLKYMTTSARQTLTIQLKSANSLIHINAKDGYLYLTNKRLVYITASQGDINSFLIDLTLAPRLQLSHELKSPWFGPNYWQFMFFSVATPSIASDGFPKNNWFQGQIYFNDGGLFDFIEIFNQTLHNAVNRVDEELPAYSS